MSRKRAISSISGNANLEKFERKIRALKAELEHLRSDEEKARKERRRAEEREQYEQDSLRWCIIGHVPPAPLSELVRKYIRQKMVVDEVVSAVLEAAVELPPHEYARLLGEPARALCPLCGDGPDTRYHQLPDRGYGSFSVPIEGEYGYTRLGLERHLIGYANFRQCVVMKEAAVLFNRERERRKEQDEQRRAMEARETSERSRRLADPNEPLIAVGPDSKGDLYDSEHSSLDEAERPLLDAGFEKRVEGRLRVYVLTFRDLLIYADLRNEFHAFRGSSLLGTVQQPTSGQGWRKRLEGKLAKHSPLRPRRRSTPD
jgi:hypothetical protein